MSLSEIDYADVRCGICGNCTGCDCASKPALSAVEEIAVEFVWSPPYCLTFPEGNCKLNTRIVQRWCLKCRLRAALGIRFQHPQPKGRWWH